MASFAAVAILALFPYFYCAFLLGFGNSVALLCSLTCIANWELLVLARQALAHRMRSTVGAQLGIHQGFVQYNYNYNVDIF